VKTQEIVFGGLVRILVLATGGLVERPAFLVIVSNAESARNQAKKGSVYFADDAARRIVRGTPDHLIELTEDGHKQAAQTGHAIRERLGVIDHVYMSGYARTDQTAESILAAYPAEERERMKLRMNIFSRERDPGFTYDMTEDGAEAAFPWLNEYWRTFGGFHGATPGLLVFDDPTGSACICTAGRGTASTTPTGPATDEQWPLHDRRIRRTQIRKPTVSGQAAAPRGAAMDLVSCRLVG
jgi:hypothetical protein